MPTTLSSSTVLSAYNGWNSVACYEDVVSARVLPYMQQISGGMTVEKCLDACLSSGYGVAGLEWAQECFCGSSLPSIQATDGRCNMSCLGNTNEICGGSLGLTVYQYSGSVPSSGYTYDNCYVDSVSNRVLPHQLSVSGGMTIEKCVDACKTAGYPYAGLEYSHECFCGASAPPEIATDGRCTMTCEGNGSEICGGPNGLSVYTGTPTPANPNGPSNSPSNSPSNLATYKTWTYDNCYVDSIWNRALPNSKSVSGSMTIEKCLDACDAAGYAFGGLEYSSECYCGTAAPSQVANDGRCNMACQGNPNELCGGSNGLSVYHSSNSAAAPQPIDSYNGWSFTGCYKDSIHNRVLPQRAAPEHDYDQTIEICIDACNALGYVFAGLEYGSECWCGNWKPWDIANDGRCNMACVGDHKERCGGPDGLDVYEYHPQTTVVTAFTTTTAVVGTFTTATTIATVVEGTGTYAETITTTTNIVVPATYTTTIVSPLTITTTAVIPYTTTTTVIGDVTLTSTIGTTLVGSTTVVVPIVGSTTQPVPLTGSTTVAVPVTGSTTGYFPVTTSTGFFVGVPTTTLSLRTFAYPSATLSIYTGTTSFADPFTTIYQPVIILTTLVKSITTTSTRFIPFTTSVATARPLTLTGSDIDYFTATSSAIIAVPTTSLAINTFPAVSSDIAGVTTTSTFYVPFTSQTTGFIPVQTSSVNVGSYTSSSVDIEPVPGSTTVVTEYTTTSVGYTPYTTTAYDAQTTTFVATVATPITVTTTFITRVDDPQYTSAP